MLFSRLIKGFSRWAETKGFEFVEGDKYVPWLIYKKSVNDDLENWLYISGEEFRAHQIPDKILGAVRFAELSGYSAGILKDKSEYFPWDQCQYVISSPIDCRECVPIKRITDLEASVMRMEDHYTDFLKEFYSQFKSMKDLYLAVERQFREYDFGYNTASFGMPADIVARTLLKARFGDPSYPEYLQKIIEATNGTDHAWTSTRKSNMKELLDELIARSTILYEENQGKLTDIEFEPSPHISSPSKLQMEQVKAANEKYFSHWLDKYPDDPHCIEVAISRRKEAQRLAAQRPK